MHSNVFFIHVCAFLSVYVSCKFRVNSENSRNKLLKACSDYEQTTSVNDCDRKFCSFEAFAFLKPQVTLNQVMVNLNENEQTFRNFSLSTAVIK